ncbi:MAG: hypothetical protein OK438_08840 [Thaumarchaeota archaeon]|nr:hypothetical protein [Nitrososphaerota archaeon]
MDFRSLGKWGYAGETVVFVALALSLFYTSATYATSSSSSVANPTLSHLVSYLTTLAVATPGAIVGLAWFSAGRGGRSTLFKVTGVFGLITSIGGAAYVLWLGAGFLNLVPASPSTSLVLTSAGSTLQTPTPQFLGALLTFLLLGVAVSIVAVSFVVTEIVSFFSAKGIFGVRYFRYAAWGRIIAIIAGGVILLVVFFEAVLAYALSTTSPNPSGDVFLGQALFAGYGAALLLWAIPEMLAALAFRAIPTPEAPLSPAPIPV